MQFLFSLTNCQRHLKECKHSFFPCKSPTFLWLIVWNAQLMKCNAWECLQGFSLAAWTFSQTALPAKKHLFKRRICFFKLYFNSFCTFSVLKDWYVSCTRTGSWAQHQHPDFYKLWCWHGLCVINHIRLELLPGCIVSPPAQATPLNLVTIAGE